MLLRLSIGLCLLFAIVYSAPLLSTNLENFLHSSQAKSGISTNELKVPTRDAPTSINYETLGGGYEGDMIFPDGFDPKKPTQPRGVAIAGPRSWPNNVIPYDLSAITDQGNRDLIKSAMQTLMDTVNIPAREQRPRRDCVSFRERTASDKDFVQFVYGSGCSGTVGYSAGSQHTITLAKFGCFYSGIIQHELIHTLGFFHEQSRPDRDDYITINYDNIQENMQSNFDKYQWGSQVLNQNRAYDYGSIMHYPANAFSKNGQPTITTKQQATLGQRSKLSKTDIDEIRRYYRCE